MPAAEETIAAPLRWVHSKNLRLTHRIKITPTMKPTIAPVNPNPKLSQIK